MTRAIFATAAALLLIGGGAIAYKLAEPLPPTAAPRAAESRPALALLTSLPLMFAEQFAIDGGSPALVRLERRYDVRPIAVADAASLKGKTMLLMAHPRAQPAEVLVELDAWVRAGWVEVGADDRLRCTVHGWLRLDALAAALTHHRSR